MKLALAEPEKNQGRNKNLNNRKAKKRNFQVGDQVLVFKAGFTQNPINVTVRLRKRQQYGNGTRLRCGIYGERSHRK